MFINKENILNIQNKLFIFCVISEPIVKTNLPCATRTYLVSRIYWYSYHTRQLHKPSECYRPRREHIFIYRGSFISNRCDDNQSLQNKSKVIIKMFENNQTLNKSTITRDNLVVNNTSLFSWTSEADASEVQEDSEDMFLDVRSLSDTLFEECNYKTIETRLLSHELYMTRSKKMKV